MMGWLLAFGAAILFGSGYIAGRMFELSRINRGYYWVDLDEDGDAIDASREGRGDD